MLNEFSLKGKRILITGASSGIGRQCAITASHFGAEVVLIARNEERLKQTLSQMEKGNHLLFPLDITENDKLENIIKLSVEKLGKLSGFVHSAGIELTMPLKSMTAEDYHRIFAVNVISGLELARIISKKKYLSEQGASFVFISSIMALIGNAGLTAYSASKGALISAAKSMAIELAAKKVRVNCISPGYVQTEMMNNVSKSLTEEQMARLKKGYLLGLGQPDDVANACLFLLAEASRWITGTNLIIDGGYTAQ